MPRPLAFLALACLLLVACYPTVTPVAEQMVTLVAVGDEDDIPLFRDALSPFESESARVPSETECLLTGTTSWERGHGNETVTFYKVNCDGTVGWVGEPSVVFAPGASSSQ